nr:hypothetical protein [Tanacetum cinerariifolium]
TAGRRNARFYRPEKGWRSGVSGSLGSGRPAPRHYARGARARPAAQHGRPALAGRAAARNQ